MPVSSLQLQAVAGTLQIVPAGLSLQPVTVRVTDSSVPTHPVPGASVSFLSTLDALPKISPSSGLGEAGISQPTTPVMVSKSQTTVQSDVNRIASIPVSTGGISGNVAVVGSATAGTSSVQFAAQPLEP